MIGGYSSDYKSLELVSSGPGRLSDFIAALKSELGDSKIGWGGFRCYGVDDRGNTVSKRAKIGEIRVAVEGPCRSEKSSLGVNDTTTIANPLPRSPPTNPPPSPPSKSTVFVQYMPPSAPAMK